MVASTALDADGVSEGAETVVATEVGGWATSDSGVGAPHPARADSASTGRATNRRGTTTVSHQDDPRGPNTTRPDFADKLRFDYPRSDHFSSAPLGAADVRSRGDGPGGGTDQQQVPAVGDGDGVVVGARSKPGPDHGAAVVWVPEPHEPARESLPAA